MLHPPLLSLFPLALSSEDPAIERAFLISSSKTVSSMLVAFLSACSRLDGSSKEDEQ